MKKPTTKIAVTLFNLRAHCKTAADLDTTLAKVKAIGYEAVQVSGIGKIEPQTVKELLDKHGLYVCATHEGLDALRANRPAIMDKLKLWECDFTALGSPGQIFSWSAEERSKLIKELEETGADFKKNGLMFGYHNHHFEFQKFNGSTFLETLYRETDPTKLYAELDLHWIQRGGQNPVDWIYKVEGRMPVVHFKDFTIIDSEPYFCEIGEGNLNWQEIIKACEKTGVRWYSIEQDKELPGRDIFTSIEISYNNLKKMGVN